ncbi:MAG: prepilin peptidase [Naasia sp.]|nr:prepilin peptidase [Naasia sp.]
MLVWQAPAALVLAIGAALALGPAPALVGALYLAAVTPEFVRIDVREHRLPDRLTLPGYAAAVAGVALAAVTGSGDVPAALLAGGGGVVLFLLLAVAGGMGLGDVKLVGALGVTLGLSGAEAAVLALLVAFLAGGVAAGVVLLRHGRSSRLAFGPYLLLGFWLALLLAA